METDNSTALGIVNFTIKEKHQSNGQDILLGQGSAMPRTPLHLMDPKQNQQSRLFYQTSSSNP